MKTIQNLKFPSPASGEDITTAVLLKGCLRLGPKDGFDFQTMRGRMRVMDALEKIQDNAIILEDADYATAVQAVKDTRWTACESHLLKFAEQFGL